MNTVELSSRISPEQANRQTVEVAIAKVVRGCNIFCDYCYEYNMPDQSWRQRPPFMSDEVVERFAYRSAQHVVDNELDELTIALHGGEPFLALKSDPDYFARFVDTFRTAGKDLGWGGEFKFGVQTNGTLLTEKYVEECRRLGIKIGVSIDGNEKANFHRLDRKGRSTHAKAEEALRLVGKYPDLQVSTLVVMDKDNDALETYHYLRRLESYERPGADYAVRAIEFAFPHANWTELPKGYKGPLEPVGYGEQLAKVFDTWLVDHGPGKPAIPLFNEIIRLLVGLPGGLEYFGPSIPRVITVRSDGVIDDVDTMSSTAPGRMNLSLNVFENSFDEVLDHPKVRARQMGELGLAAACVICPIKDVCAGGYFAHRYKKGSNLGVSFPELDEFLNRSVYCADLYQLVEHIARRLAERPLTFSIMVRGGRGQRGIWRQLLERSKEEERAMFADQRDWPARSLRADEEEREARERNSSKEPWEQLPAPNEIDLSEVGVAAARRWVAQQGERKKLIQMYSRDRRFTNS